MRSILQQSLCFFKIRSLVLLLITLGGNQMYSQVLITEVADPADVFNNRYVEICNRGASPVDISNYDLRRYSNGGTSPVDIAVNGTVMLQPGECYVFHYSSAAQSFSSCIGTTSSGSVNGNGDDVYALYDGTSNIDIYGVIGTDGTGESWEYTDDIVTRNQAITGPNATFDLTEWTINTSSNTADGNPCVDADLGGAPSCTVTITTIMETDPSTIGGSDGEITIIASGISLSGSLQYSIDGGMNFFSTNTFTGLSASTYDIVVEDDMDGACEDTDQAILSDPAAPSSVIITEVADPNDNFNNRYVEICNRGVSAVDISGYQLQRYTNGGTSPTNISISGTVILDPGDCFVFYNNSASLSLGACAGSESSGSITGSGDDVYGLTDGSGLIDVYGVIGVDGTGENWEYTDAIVTRNQSVTTSTTSFDISEWTITDPADTADGNPCIDADLGGSSTCVITIDNVMLTNPSANGGTDGEITINVTGMNLTGMLEYSIDGGGGFQTGNVFSNLSGGTYDIVVQDDMDSACFDTDEAMLVEPPASNGAGSILFQMINPCGNDADNEFVVIALDGDTNIDDIALGSVTPGGSSWNFFWTTDNSNIALGDLAGSITSANFHYSLLDPGDPTDATEITNRIAEINGTTGSNTNVFKEVPADGVIPGGSSVIIFLGASSDPGFDDALNNLPFSDPTFNNACIYAVFGNGGGAAGFFSNSDSRDQYLSVNGNVSTLSYTPSAGEPGYISAVGSYTTGGSCVPPLGVLYVDLISFDAKKAAEKVLVNWAASLQVDTDYFMLERAGEELKFETIAEIAAISEVQERYDYSFVDDRPLNGVSYYRLKEVEFDGTVTVLGIRAVDRKDDQNNTVQVYPVPATSTLNLFFSTTAEQENDWLISIYNLQGQLIQEEVLPANTVLGTIDINTLAAGAYLINWSNAYQSGSQRIIKR